MWEQIPRYLNYVLTTYKSQWASVLLELLVIGDDVSWGQWQPHGMAYWESLKMIMDREVFPKRDRFADRGFGSGRNQLPRRRGQCPG